jgi:hypothetical protein
VSKVINPENLKTCDLLYNARYKSRSGNLSDEAIANIFPVGNRGGFRKSVQKDKERTVNFVVIFSTFRIEEWPDSLYANDSKFIYYGDKKGAGNITSTKKGGNKFLLDVEKSLNDGRKDLIPPIFVFTSVENSRDAFYKGMAVPSTDRDFLQLVKIESESGSLENLKADFDILKIDASRLWINDLLNGNKDSVHTPTEFMKWKESNESTLNDNLFGSSEFDKADFNGDFFFGESIENEYDTEGTLKKVYVNVYERSAYARKKCIKHWGLSCKVCGLNFEDAYGQLGKGFIHVHHVKPINESVGPYIVDYVNDLIPICPNCHAMIHRGNQTLSIEDLKKIINLNKK